MIALGQHQRDRRAAQFEVALRRGTAQHEDALDPGNVLDAIIDRRRRGIRVFQHGVRRKLDRQRDARGIFRGRKLPGTVESM